MLWREKFWLTLILQLGQKTHQNLCLQLKYILEPPTLTCFRQLRHLHQFCSWRSTWCQWHVYLWALVPTPIHHFLQIGATLGAWTLPNSHPSMLPPLSLVQTRQDSSCMLHDSHYKLVLFSTEVLHLNHQWYCLRDDWGLPLIMVFWKWKVLRHARLEVELPKGWVD